MKFVVGRQKDQRESKRMWRVEKGDTTLTAGYCGGKSGLRRPIEGEKSELGTTTVEVDNREEVRVEERRTG